VLPHAASYFRPLYNAATTLGYLANLFGALQSRQTPTFAQWQVVKRARRRGHQ
jgi:hypothetical protein